MVYKRVKLISFCFVVLVFLFLSFDFSLVASAQEAQGSSNVYAGGDGSTVENAVIIKAEDHAGRDFQYEDYVKSIGSEYEYIEKKFGVKGKDWELSDQKLVKEGERSYDKMTVKVLSSQEEKTLYFDISEPMGELEKQLQKTMQGSGD
jgi:hypothetical protein